VAYDVKRLNSIRQGEAEVSDSDAIVEIVAGMVETMVRAQGSVSASLEDRYRNQLRTLREVMRRQGVEAELPDSLRAWASAQPSNVPASMTRAAAEGLFEPLLAPSAEDADADLSQPGESVGAGTAASGGQSEAIFGPPRHMLEVIYETFEQTGELPTFQYVGSRAWADTESDPREVYLDLAERDLVTPAVSRSHDFQLKDDTAVGVSLQGLMHLRRATEDLSRFVSLVRHVADRACRFRPPSASKLASLSITSEEVRLHLNLEPGDRALVRLGVLISQEAWQLCSVFSGGGSDAWSFDVNLERARRYRDIHTVIDFLALSYPKGRAAPGVLPASPSTLTAAPLPGTSNRKIMVVHGRDMARGDLFSLLRALGLEPIEWSAAVKATGTTKPYNGEAVEAAFASAQVAVILLAPEERVSLRDDLRDPKDPSDAIPAWQPRPNVFYEGGIAATSHPDRTIVLELGRPRTATDLAGVNAVRVGLDQAWRHELANRLRDAGCPVNTDGSDWLNVGTFAEPDLPSIAQADGGHDQGAGGGGEPADGQATGQAQLAAAMRSGNVLRVRQHADGGLGFDWRDQVETLVKEVAGPLDASRLTHSGNITHWLEVLDDLARQVGAGRHLTSSDSWETYVEGMATFKQALDASLTAGERLREELFARPPESEARVEAWLREIDASLATLPRLLEVVKADGAPGMSASYEGMSEEQNRVIWRLDRHLQNMQPLLTALAPYVEALEGA
jgi:hypothetical protein